ncbi:MAG: HAMP domain-containing histidine kinase [Cytophagales bacterium]|nr:HAMP domain-containing histidine kinase [Cytophagales bacterium]
MKQKKNRLTLALSITSMALLLALQALWLTNAYERAYFDLRRETNGLFRTTVVALRDSLFTQSISPVMADSNVTIVQNKLDSTWKKLPDAASQVRVYISSTIKADTLDNILKPIAGRLHARQFASGRSFMIQLSPDSLSPDTLRHHFELTLQKNNLPLSINVMSSKEGPPRIDFASGRFRMNETHWDDMPLSRTFSNTLHTEWVRFNPAHRYAAKITNFRMVLLRQIAPQVLFSVFLTLITTLAFLVMYRSIRSQQKLMALKNDFISNITHELKTPVTTVGVALEAIKNFKAQNNPELTNEYLEIARNELNRLNILTDKILKTTIFEDKGVVYKAEPVDLQQIVTTVLSSLKLVFEKQEVVVQTQFEGTDFVVPGGEAHLTSVIYNLLDNALKYSPVSPAILVQLQEEETMVSLLIQDNGIGIAPEFHKKVFEKFFRVPTGNVHTTKGYGLGLSYVESVIKSHRGTISVQSEPGKGSTFIIRLPKTNG